jgi:hypothetical protein
MVPAVAGGVRAGARARWSAPRLQLAALELFGAYLMDLPEMQFRHSIAIEMKNCLPIPERLYPAHYSLLYFTKGKPKTFRKFARRSRSAVIVTARSVTMAGTAMR